MARIVSFDWPRYGMHGLTVMLALCTVLPAQDTEQYLSDRIWASATNATGPVERNRAVGGPTSGDGTTLKVFGQEYTKGLGVAAPSEIRYTLSGVCSTFKTKAGVDESAGEAASVLFQVWADDTMLWESGVLTRRSEPAEITLDVSGKQQLTLLVTDGGDGQTDDIADWIEPSLTCGRWGTPTERIIVDGQKDVLISGVSITSTDGPCITVTGNSENVRIENSELGPCAGGILVEGARNVDIDNVYIRDAGTTGNGIDVTFSEGVIIRNSRMERVRSGVYALRSTGVRVENNSFLNVQGPLPRGQYIQFNHVYGRGNVIFCNRGENFPGESDVVEAINLYDSFGEADDPIQVVGNVIQGGGPSESSGAILLGDGGGSYQVARDNLISEPGQQGIGIAGGNDITAMNNIVHARQQPFTNVGMYVWNQDISRCFNITVEGNHVNWTNRDGKENPFWNAGNCGTVQGVESNGFGATIDMQVLHGPAAVCQAMKQ